MKIFCTILLVGIVAYVAATEHPCDPFAANTEEKPGTKEANDQVIALESFSAGKETEYFVTEATRSEVPRSWQFCTGPTYGNGCEAVGHYRKITEEPEEGSVLGAKEIEFDEVFVGVSKKTARAIKYKMKIKGVNEDDYIFQKAPGTEIEIKEYNVLEEENDIQIDEKVEEILESEFALFYHKDKIFSIYITCDGKNMWVSFNKEALNGKIEAATYKELSDQVKKLKAIAFKEKQTKLTLVPVPTKMIKEFEKLIPKAAPAA